mmetsp:Transcript_21538/g.49714  ORF Transcript_21538/g.49714 Transcript_21538/m.49714 type:complete len:213 (+) Transcript_21538:447-1085(+)
MFEGGQTRFYKRIPKRGFNNSNARQMMTPLNVGTLQDYVDMGRLSLDENAVLTIKDFVDAGIFKASSIKHGVKLLAKGKERLSSPLRIHVSRASTAAIEALENVGGQVLTVHYNPLALRAMLKPEAFQEIPKRAKPPPRLLPYYTNWNRNRGYLSPQAQLQELLRKRPQLLTPQIAKVAGLQQPSDEDSEVAKEVDESNTDKQDDEREKEDK